MSIVINIIIIFGLFTAVFLSPFIMNIGLVRVSNKDYTVDIKDYIYCSIPVFNHFYGWKKYAGKLTSISGISTVMLYLILIIRTISMIFYYGNESLQLYTVYAFLICFLVFWICNMIDIYSVLNDSGLYTLANKIVYSFVFVVGQIIIGYYMPRKMYYYYSKNNKGDLYGRS